MPLISCLNKWCLLGKDKHTGKIWEIKPNGNYCQEVRVNKRGSRILHTVFRRQRLQHSKIRNARSIPFYLTLSALGPGQGRKPGILGVQRACCSPRPPQRWGNRCLSYLVQPYPQWTGEGERGVWFSPREVKSRKRRCRSWGDPVRGGPKQANRSPGELTSWTNVEQGSTFIYDFTWSQNKHLKDNSGHQYSCGCGHLVPPQAHRSRSCSKENWQSVDINRSSVFQVQRLSF